MPRPPPRSVVWFKRDLRVHDHPALAAAAAHGEVLPLFVFEPGYLALPDVSARQVAHQRAAVDDLRRQLASLSGALVVEHDDVLAVLRRLHAALGPFTLFSHQETGNAWTYARDRAVRRLCRELGVVWHEPRQNGVLRATPRDGWAKRWDAFMREPTVPVPSPIRFVGVDRKTPLPTLRTLRVARDPLDHLWPTGRRAALADLASFLAVRGERYTTEMSSPLVADRSCSRLSAHLAYGTISMREVAQATWARMAEVAALPRAERGTWPQSLRSFLARLHWHCHFVQKLETEPEAEHLPLAREYVGLRPRPADPEKLAAWAEGRTGYPFVDACMRSLRATGWINFRMRAMLMSFASYDLWLPWQETGMVLARLFVDYEPGIHWPQAQMQSGETGINTVRIYSPTKQAHDQDPEGDFVRRWVPELAAVAGPRVHTPWLFDAKEQRKARGYPARVVIHEDAVVAARKAIFALRRTPEARAEAARVYEKHGSRKRPRRRKKPA